MGLGRGLLHVMSTPAFWAIALWFVGDGAMLTGFLGLWAGPYLMDAYGLSKPAAGNVLAMIAVGMIVGAPFLGYLSDRVLTSRKKVLVGCTVAQVATWAVMLLFHGALGYTTLAGLFFVMGITVSAVGIIAVTTAKELFPVDMAGISVGAVNMFPFLGTIIFQPLAGILLDRAGTGAPYAPSAYLPVLWALLGVSVLALVCISFARETIGKEG
jgi:MFS family permease